MKRQRAVFLDRDGTLNEDVGYPGHIHQIHIPPFAFEAVRRIRGSGFAAVVVTNQSGIGRGFYSESTLRTLHDGFAAAFSAAGAKLDGIYHCPHYAPPGAPEPGPTCSCAKPGPGLGLLAAKELGVDLARSYVIGDKIDDLLFGLNIGAVPILVLTGYGRESLQDLPARRVQPAFVARDVLAAADWIVEREARIPAARPSLREGSTHHDPL